MGDLFGLSHVPDRQGIVVLPESTATFYRRPDLTYGTIRDIGPNHVSLAWDASRRSRLIHEFAEVAGEHERGRDSPIARKLKTSV